MTKEMLIKEVRRAFENVKLEEGIGLWEGQGIDDYADKETILKLKEKDERNNWDSLPYEDLVACQSSLSFFDAKGMRFCLPKFIIFEILTEQIYNEKGLYSPDILFTLTYNLNDEYQKKRFSLLDSKQIEVVIHYLEFKLSQMETKRKEYSSNIDTAINMSFWDNECVELEGAIKVWKQKLH
jgi:hypothetical protein